MNQRSTPQKGFTLIELLVVIAIIAILAAILFPVFAAAKETAKKATCLTQLRQIGTATYLYLGDNDDLLPDRKDIKLSLGFRPWTTWPPSDPRAGWIEPVLGPYLKSQAVTLCPSTKGKPIGEAIQVRQGNLNYWMWRFDRVGAVTELDNFWGKSPEQAVDDLIRANNPTVGVVSGTAEVELAVDPYFPATIPTVPTAFRGQTPTPEVEIVCFSIFTPSGYAISERTINMSKLFLAFELNPETRSALSEYLPKVQEKLGRQGMKWTRPEKWHVTVRFIGDEDPATIVEALQESLKGLKAPTLEIGLIGGLPDTKRPGVLHLDVENNDGHAIAAFKKTAGLGEEVETYAPHITLARMKPASTKLGHKLRDFMYSGERLTDVSWTPSDLVLMDSLPDGTYAEIARFPLEG